MGAGAALLQAACTENGKERFMTPRKIALFVALICMAPAAMVVAQTDPSAQGTSPSSASSPTQREATQSNAPEAATNDSTNPSSASTPSQQQALRTASKQSMKNCIAKQQQESSGMSAADAKKACKAQMKNNSG
jgi:hypothetical protein